MPKSPFLKKHKLSAKVISEKRRRQKFAIWDYYKKKNSQKTDNRAKTK